MSNARGEMLSSARVTRLLFGLVTVVAAVALALHSLNWQRRGSMDWPALCNMLGLLVLGMTGALDPPRGPLRLAMSAVALALIFPSALVLLTR